MSFISERNEDAWRAFVDESKHVRYASIRRPRQLPIPVASVSICTPTLHAFFKRCCTCRYASLDPRRKNATKESTNTLKAWLYEHKKNPYPTKGEKIMLAIITRMTLTQVSTWFANARRRLKKERGAWNGEDDDDEDVEVEKDDSDEVEEGAASEERLRGMFA